MEEIFLAFCDSCKKGSKTATDKTVKKICTDCQIYNKNLNANLVDIALRKHIGNQKLDMDFNSFVRFIEGHLGEAYAASKKIELQKAVEEIKGKIMQGNPKAHGATQVSSDAATARLTDVKGYTGAHKERFDMETGKGKGIEGREYIADENAQAGYVGGYKGKDTYDKTH
ncbi:Tubulin polymerization-promoting protein [Fasciola hepatica]|uniref:Tubulin polymerization-promoting protein n=1 Tax=Fasciola hepatica TaxID=6192 RepID=A0A2H1CVK1_FASHE|nr:Tubulin polymerization-promoting protein [Fasciola hepatica]